MGVIFAKKTKAQKTRKLPHTKISTFTVHHNTEKLQNDSVFKIVKNIHNHNSIVHVVIKVIFFIEILNLTVAEALARIHWCSTVACWK